MVCFFSNTGTSREDCSDMGLCLSILVFLSLSQDELLKQAQKVCPVIISVKKFPKLWTLIRSLVSCWQVVVPA